jgi:hypothetical protein
LTKNCQRWNSPSQENVLGVWRMMQVWLNEGEVRFGAWRCAKSNESVCGWSWGKKRCTTRPHESLLRCSYVHVEWVPAQCLSEWIRTNGEKKQMANECIIMKVPKIKREEDCWVVDGRRIPQSH